MPIVALDHLDCDPVAAAVAAARLPGLCLLHSGLRAYGLGRYSILAACPEATFRYEAGVAEVENGGVTERRAMPLFDALDTFCGTTNVQARPEEGVPFEGGAIGYLAYEAGYQLEAYPEVDDVSGAGRTEARFSRYAGGLVFDHERGIVYATSRDGDPLKACEPLLEAIRGPARPVEPFRLRSTLRAGVAKEAFLRSVDSIRELIRDGDVYQVNLSQPFEADCVGAAMGLFCSLAQVNPAPYAAYLDFGDEQIVSSSPERFLLLDGRSACTRPIKGTRPAGANDAEAARNAGALAASEKDRAELLMIVDLERNDLGRVCEPGTVRVENLFALERYATVIHQTAEVSGRLEDGRSWIDCVKAMFPGGSITGAPKIRSMQVIQELERRRRGVYTGSIGYVDSLGNVDFNIAIRTLRVANGKVSFQVGGGIVWDSDPESEYEETLVKAKAMVTALGGTYA